MSLVAQEQIQVSVNDSSATDVVPKKPFDWWKGLRVEVDIASPVMNLIEHGEQYQYEAAVQFVILNKYYPLLEIGIGGADKISASGIGYSTDALYYRLGTDFNILKQREGAAASNHLFLVGARLGFTSFYYDLTNLYYENPYWGTSFSRDIQHITAASLWYELSAGLRVEIAPRLYIGWTVSSRNLLTRDTLGGFKPLYIPGYGTNSTGNKWGFSYRIGYKF